jgi:hypothetical protein
VINLVLEQMIEGELHPRVDLGLERIDPRPQRVLQHNEPAGTVFHTKHSYPVSGP